MPQLEQYLPKHNDYFIDLFSGGANVGANMNANVILCNDINYRVNDFFRYLQQNDIKQVLFNIDKIIDDYHLSRIKAQNNLEENRQGFLKLRQDYNNDADSIKFYVLIAYSFNYQYRFNNKFQYNSSFGKNYCIFTNNMRNHLIEFTQLLHQKNIQFTEKYFDKLNLSKLTRNSFVYCDPPYLITTGSYNDGKRGFGGWTNKDEDKLYNLLDNLDKRNVKFALSNVIEHKGIFNEKLFNWANKYNINKLDYQYGRTYAATKNRTSQEVLITNYNQNELN